MKFDFHDIINRFRLKHVATVLLVLPVLVLFFSFFSTEKRVSAATTGTVTAASLFVRTGPGTTYDKVTSGGETVVLVKGSYVAISYETNGWYYITASFSGKRVNGYVSAAYIATNGAVPTGAPSATPTASAKATATPTPAATKKATSTPKPTEGPTITTEVVTSGFPLTGNVTAGSLNVRNGAGTSNTKIDSIKLGQKVTITEAKKASSGEYWYHISYTLNGESKTGYVSAAYISVEISSKPTPTPTSKVEATPTPIPTGSAVVAGNVVTSGFPYTGYCNTAGLNVRKGPGTGYSIVTTLSENQYVTITGFEYDVSIANKVWYKISFKKNNVEYTGYASSLYMAVLIPTVTNTPTPTLKPDATATPVPTASPTPTPEVSFTGDSIDRSEVSDSEVAFYVYTGIVNTFQLNMRSGPYTDTAAIAILKSGTKVFILGLEEVDGVTWYKVAVKDNGEVKYGYISTKYTKLVFTENVYGLVLNGETKLSTTMSETTSYVKDSNGNILELSAGTGVKIIEESNSGGTKWWKIKTAEGAEGYVKSTALDLASENEFIIPVTPTPTPIPTAKPSATPIPTATTAPGKTPTPVGQATPTPQPTKPVYDSETGIQMYHYKVYTVMNGVTQLMMSGVDYYFPAVSMSAPLGYLFESVEVFPDNVTTGYTSFIKAHSLTQDETYYYYYTRDPNYVSNVKWNPNMTDAEFENYMNEQGFPESYKPYLREIHAQYPAWVLVAYQTGISWDDAIASENVVGRNLIPNSYSVAWKSLETGAYSWATDTFILYDGSTWVTASAKALAYFIDPRNWLNPTNIFMFESLTYRPEYQTVEGVEALLENTPFSHKSFTYVDNGGVTRTMTYAEAFITAAEYSGVSPYHLAARVRQEIVKSSTTVSDSATGTVDGYEGLYNFYNIGAYHSTVSGGAVKNGLKYARNGASNSDELNDASLIPWTDPYRAIVGGAYIIGKNYINRGQDTIYLQKFNMTPDNTFMHQYMANVVAPSSESKRMATAYTDMNTPITFMIPVFVNMPYDASEQPSTEYNPNNWLKDIKVSTSDGTSLSLMPSFNQTIDQDYYVNVSSTTDMIQIQGIAVSSKATVSGNGMVALNYGMNTFEIYVTAENGDVKTYIVNVTRQDY